MEVTDEQWDEAERLFKAEFEKSKITSMDEEKYRLICDLLHRWDSLSAKERQELGGGNHNFWRRKYKLLVENAGEEDERWILAFRQMEGIVAHSNNTFQCIKAVHEQSKLHARATCMHAHVS